MSFFSNIGSFIKDKASDLADKLNLDTRSILNKDKIQDLGNSIKQSVVGGVKVASGQSTVKAEFDKLVSGINPRSVLGSIVPLSQNSPPVNIASGVVNTPSGVVPPSRGVLLNTPIVSGPINKPVLFDNVKNEGISPMWIVLLLLGFALLKKYKIL